jgi:branched-chain amino acid transport system ATP-binding protein
MPLLEICGMSAGYGDGSVLRDVSLQLDEGSISSLIGANGAGKTTLMRVVSGLLRPSSGSITYDSRRIDTALPEEIVALGLAHVPEGRRLFPQMTVLENLLVGASSSRAAKVLKSNLDLVFRIFPKVHERRAQLAGTLSGGEQQAVAIGRALMTNPRLLLLDETSLGLAPVIVTEIFKAVVELTAAGMTVLIVEQNIGLALKVATNAFVLEHGSIVLQGAAKELAGDERVRRAYLGL